MTDSRQLHCGTADRRHFLRLAGLATIGLSGIVSLAGCGGGGADASQPITVTPGGDTVSPAPSPTPTPSATPSAGNVLNLALNLEYLGGQYYAAAATGAPLPASLTSGIGAPGAATGGRKTAFSDQRIARYAADIAADKRANIVALRGILGAAAAAQPAIDLSGDATSAFSLAAQTSGMVTHGAAFDPFGSDQAFLLGGFLVENIVAAVYRNLASGVTDAATLTALGGNLGNAIYHGGLMRTMLARQTSAGASLAGLCRMFAGIDGSDAGDQALTSTGTSINLDDSAGDAIPFLRSTDQALRDAYLSATGAAGGFFPAGINGLAG